MEPTEVPSSAAAADQTQSDLPLSADAVAPRPEAGASEQAAEPAPELDAAQLKAIVEAVIYITDEPLSADQIATALRQPAARIGEVLL